MVIALLAGGTGGAKLACGLRDVLGSRLSVIANTADDIEIYDVHVSPDPDLITYRLAGVLGERGYGIAGESSNQQRALELRGVDTWLALGDEDFDVCRSRAEAMADGHTLTAAHAMATVGYDCGGARVLPMCDAPVRTEVLTPTGWRGLQQYMVIDRCEPAIEDVRFSGIEQSEPTDAVLETLATADAVVIGPSNPVISINPILSVPGMRAAIADADLPVLAVSPFVDGEVLKGPTAKFMQAAGFAPDVDGFASYYEELADILVADQELAAATPQMTMKLTSVAMPDQAGQRALAETVVSTARRAARKR